MRSVPHKKTPLGYDINYPVPNFGVDQDIIDSHVNLANTEKIMGHKIIMGTPESRAKWHNVAKDTLYNFKPALDADVRTTQKNLADSENNLGHSWVIEDAAVQLDADERQKGRSSSDPICSSAGCT